MNFSLEQLLAFVTVYEQKAFSKAAVKLDKHRTTIGQVITNLEDQLAITLFERIGRSVEPTQDATLLYHYAKQAIEQTRTFNRVALSLSFGGLESINIAYASFIPQQVLAHIRKQLLQDFPFMNVNWLVRSKQEIKEGVQDGSIHFGLVNIFTSKVINSLDSSLLHNMRFLPFTGKDTELAKLPPSETFITMKSSKQFVLKSMLDDDMANKIIVSSNYEVIDQQALMIQMVQEGLGWALFPEFIKKLDHFSDGLVEIAADEIKEAVLVPISLWCQHSKQNVDIKKSIMVCIDNYLNKLSN